MNGQMISDQTSGNHWMPPHQAMAHESVQERSSFLYTQTSIFDDLEGQMAWLQEEHNELTTDLRRYYVFQSDFSVRAFLRTRRTLSQVLASAIEPLQQSFGDSLVVLSATADEEGWRMLYGVVLWRGLVPDVRAAFDCFDEWWIAHSRQAAGTLTFTYELV